jgi:glyoxylase-like metal-dependent hydrolase (beta-lactamase superfamily II)
VIQSAVPTLSRRSLVRNMIGLATGTTICSWKATAISPPINDASKMIASGTSAKITVQKLRRNISVLVGSGGNIAVLSGSDGKLLVDAGFGTSQRQIRNALESVGRNPPRQLIDTHWHFDHTDGNQWIHDEGATIIGHENTARRLSARQEIPDFIGVFPPYPSAAIPSIVFFQKKTLSLNSEELALEYYGPAHSDSDISVRFTEADVLHTGDTWFNGVYPFIDYHNGGTLDGMLAATIRNLNTTGRDTIIVPGHGPVGNRSQLTQYSEMLNEVREKVMVLKKRGLSESETVAARPSAPFDLKWGQALVPAGAFIKLVYAGV